jgi:Fic/DOC family
MYERLARVYDAQTQGGVSYGNENDAAATAAVAAAALTAEEDITCSPARLSELSQHTAALRYLCFDCQPSSSKPLTVDMILHTHQLLMQSQDSNAGSFRSTFRMDSMGWAYIAPEHIPSAVQRAVREFNDAATASTTAAAVHPVQRAADLYYTMTQIHAFTEGNSVLCSLLVSYAFMSSSGAPFCVPLLNGHSKSGSQLRKCVRQAHLSVLRGDYKHALYSYFALCYARSWSAFDSAVASGNNSA